MKPPMIIINCLRDGPVVFHVIVHSYRTHHGTLLRFHREKHPRYVCEHFRDTEILRQILCRPVCSIRWLFTAHRAYRHFHRHDVATRLGGLESFCSTRGNLGSLENSCTTDGSTSHRNDHNDNNDRRPHRIFLPVCDAGLCVDQDAGRHGPVSEGEE